MTVRCVAAAFVVVCVAGIPAQAHASLVSVDPRDGATVTSAPQQVRLVFDEVVQSRFSAVAVTGPGGQRVDRGAPQFLDSTVTQALGPLPGPGRYVITYRIVSADGHPVSAQQSFAYRPAAGGGAAPTSSPSSAPSSSSAGAAASPATPAAAAGRRASREHGFLASHVLHLLTGAVIIFGGGIILWRDRRNARALRQ